MSTRLPTAAAGAVALAGFLALASGGPALGVVALVLALGVVVVIALGTERAGATALVLAMFTAPWNGVRVIPSVSVLTLSDVLFAVGFALLLPRLAAHPPQLPAAYKIGAWLLVLAGIVSSALSGAPLSSLGVLARLLVAAIALPVAISMWSPTLRQIDACAWAYVAGQAVNTAYAVTQPSGDAYVRAIGLTTHPNFLGLGGQTGFALLIYLHHRTPLARRWIVYVAAAVMTYSVMLSGSRASLLILVLLAVVFPLVERTAAAWYVVLGTGSVVISFAGFLISRAAPGSALGRLRGEGSATGSDEARRDSLSRGFHQFVNRPLTGNGWGEDLLLTHNAFVEVGVAGGVIALLGYLFIAASMVRPLFAPIPNRMAYVALSLFAVGAIDPYLWERIAWAAVALVFAAAPGRHRDPDTSGVPDTPANLTRASRLQEPLVR